MTVDIYKLNISSRLESVEYFLTSDRNKELILNFVDYCFSEGLGEHRILKYITTLKYIAQSVSSSNLMGKSKFHIFTENLRILLSLRNIILRCIKL
jgi:hypothetical protein